MGMPDQAAKGTNAHLRRHVGADRPKGKKQQTQKEKQIDEYELGGMPRGGVLWRIGCESRNDDAFGHAGDFAKTRFHRNRDDGRVLNEGGRGGHCQKQQGRQNEQKRKSEYAARPSYNHPSRANFHQNKI